jgi:hypothetical protein
MSQTHSPPVVSGTDDSGMITVDPAGSNGNVAPVAAISVWGVALNSGGSL